ncbi:MAG: glycosyltransferase family 4 protein [Flavobacterium sp.]|nr:glycosyltransferase family 4 protein [Pedobacter sp.]
MKILHLNSYKDNGGAGKAASRINLALQNQGIDSELWVNFSPHNSKVKTFSSGIINHGFTAAAIVLERIISKLNLKPLKTPFSFSLFGKDISAHPSVIQADILHLHWINHAFMRPADLAKLGKLGKPIVWTFHDSNAFTGGCHVRYSCDHFKRECGNCPLLKSPYPNDWSHRIWKRKAKAYSDMKFHVIAPSKWMADSVKQSKLLSNRNIHVIHNTLNTEVFKPLSKQESKKQIHINNKTFVMLSGFMPSRNDRHKGTSYLIKALEIIIKEIAAEQIELLVFGNRNQKNLPDFPVKVTFLGKIESEEELAKCYSAADVFLAPSLEDNLPYTVMESLACGTPVVAFKTGGIPDMVKHKENGYLADYKSFEDLARGIKWVFDHPERQYLNDQARQTVENLFSPAVIASRHIELYKSLIFKDVSA